MTTTGGGQINFLDTFSTNSNTAPTVDSQQDLLQTSGSVANGILTAQFSRTLVAQESNDKGLEQLCVTLLFPTSGGPMNGQSVGALTDDPEVSKHSWALPVTFYGLVPPDNVVTE